MQGKADTHGFNIGKPSYSTTRRHGAILRSEEEVSGVHATVFHFQSQNNFPFHKHKGIPPASVICKDFQILTDVWFFKAITISFCFSESETLFVSKNLPSLSTNE